jgi:hypothetical protein
MSLLTPPEGSIKKEKKKYVVKDLVMVVQLEVIKDKNLVQGILEKSV